MVDPGNLVKADDTMMTTIVSQDPLYVYFDVHEQAMLRIRRLIQEGKVKARSEKEVSLLIGLSDEKDREGNPVYPHQGMVDFTDNRVDVNTGTLRFRAKLANPNQMISPGLFVKVRLPIGEAHPALMIREQALQSDQGLKKVFVLQPKDEEGNPYFIKDAKDELVMDEKGKPIPAYKPVAVDVGTPGVLRNGFREISKGIKPGDMVVAVGMQKIRLGKNPSHQGRLSWSRPGRSIPRGTRRLARLHGQPPIPPAVLPLPQPGPPENRSSGTPRQRPRSRPPAAPPARQNSPPRDLGQRPPTR